MDLYTLLGVTRAASPAEIERAYRRLARRYHPGVNPGDRAAEEMFRRVQHAFDVLGNREQRDDYDRNARRGPAPDVPVSFQGFDFTSPAEGPLAATFTELFADVFQDAAREATTPSRGGDVELTAQLSFRDAVAGGAHPVSVVRHERCPVCSGDGRVARPPVECTDCGGSGERRWARGHMLFARPCESCDGTGRMATHPCRACSGAGVQARGEVVTLNVPPGLSDGDRLVVPGRGNAGARGGPAGDLYVTVRVAPHPFFWRVGADLHVTLPVAIHEAALGARVDVPTLDQPVRVRIPPGTPSGRTFRIRGAGVPGATGDQAGDLIAHVEIVMPPVRDERSRELLREFGRLNAVDVREQFFGADGAPGRE